ncbi:MAG: ABC transporter permease subunit [Gammaproteobacteria bacterium]|nr:ABC transporter permease subunit [Gammaproteobacteria bacterium]
MISGLLKLWLPLLWLLAVLVTALFAPQLGIRDPAAMDFIALSAPPSEDHWLGTDVLGRDLLARVAYGARVSLTVGFVAPLVGLLIGVWLGMLAGYYRGWLESVVVVAIDTLLALPGLVVLLLFALTFGGSLMNVSISLGILFIPVFTRIARANTLVYAEREFVLAARAMGARDFYILSREILPNVILPVIAYALVAVATAIVAEGALSFLGLSVPSPSPSWGGTIAEGREQLEEAPHISVVPALVMFLTVLSFNLVGDTLRARLADVRESAI